MTENQKLKNSMRMEENSTKKNEVRAESRKLAWQCIVTISNSTHKGNAQFEFLFQKSGMVYRARFIKAVLLDKESTYKKCLREE